MCISNRFRVYEVYHTRAAKGAAAEAQWNERFQKYKVNHEDLHAELSRRLAGDLPEDWRKKVRILHLQLSSSRI